MSGQGIQSFLPRVVVLAAAAGLAGAGLYFRTIDVTAAAADAEPGEVTIPEVPPVIEPEPATTDAFTRPLFHRDRNPGPDKAPATTVLPDDPGSATTPDPADKPAASSFALKGVIIGDRGARVALQAEGAAAPVWARVGQVVDGWTVTSITAQRVRLRNGDETAELKFNDK